MPEGACDCHVHIYGPYDRFPAQREGKFAPREEAPVEVKAARGNDALAAMRAMLKR